MHKSSQFSVCPSMRRISGNLHHFSAFNSLFIMLLLLNFVANFFLCTIIYLFLLISAKEKNGQKQVKKKAFKINAIIEDVGLNED